MNRTVKIVIWANLAVIAVLAFAYPHLMIRPGNLIPDHTKLEQDCFACHTPMLGAQSHKCVACHKVKDIGILTTEGKPITKSAIKTPVAFHQKLIEQECIECHSDHTGVIPFRMHQTFSHELLVPQTRDQCISCHKMPTDKVHNGVPENCAQCHTQDKWKPASFKHDLLPPMELAQCFTCHKKETPKDKVHERGGEKCGNCHKTDKWKPASFKHDLLPRAELRQCKTCHAKETPNDQRHRESSGRCGNCHYTDKWEPAKKTFGSSSSSRQPTSNQPSGGSGFPTPNPDWWRSNRDDD